MKFEPPKITLLYDDREKEPWQFKCTGIIKEVKRKRLSVGDYQIEEYDALVCIERKKNVIELYNNLVHKRKQFIKELENMSTYHNKAIICEFDMNDIMNTRNYVYLNIKSWTAMQIILSNMCKITQVYNVPIFFASNRSNAMQLVRSMIYYALKVQLS